MASNAMQDAKNIWDVIYGFIPVVATLLGISISYMLKILGKIHIEEIGHYFNYTMHQERHLDQSGDAAWEQIYEVDCYVKLHIYNSKEKYKTIKNVSLIIEADNNFYDIKYERTTLNGEPSKVNIFRIPPKQVIEIKIEGPFSSEIIENKHKKLYLIYETERGKSKRFFLDNIHDEEINNEFELFEP